MIQRLTLRNFRGIRNAQLELAPITILTGANNAGKSTVMYDLVTAKNVIRNPNQPLDSFFNLGFLNLGGFKPAVFMKDESSEIHFGIHSGDPEKQFSGQYDINLAKRGGTLQLALDTPLTLRASLEVTFPYALAGAVSATFEYKGRSYQLSWNGLAPNVAPADGQPDETVKEVSALLTLPVEEVRRVDIVPLRRGFTKPVYAAAPVTAQLLTEDEIATILSSDSDLLGRVDHALEAILNRNLVVFTPPSTATSFLQTRNRETGMTTELVNEGFGTNQLVFLLAKIHRDGTEVVCIEEPEIHLHPSAIARFVEHLVTFLLGLVAKGQVQPEDVAIYYVSRQRYETDFERCEVSPKGQVKGGLRGFYEAELEAVKNLLQIPESPA